MLVIEHLYLHSVVFVSFSPFLNIQFGNEHSVITAIRSILGNLWVFRTLLSSQLNLFCAELKLLTNCGQEAPWKLNIRMDKFLPQEKCLFPHERVMFQSLCGFLFLKRIFFQSTFNIRMKTKVKESGTWFRLKWLKYRVGNNARGIWSLGKFSTLSHPSLHWVIVNEKALLVLRSNFRPFCLLSYDFAWKSLEKNLQGILWN